MRTLALSTAVLGLCLTAAPAFAGPAEGEEGTEDEQALRQQAKTEVKAGSAAFRKGDYATALGHYEKASAIKASPKLHYNIAVCHHRLMISAKGDDARVFHNDQAIGAYNRYIEANPNAPDRHEVAETVRGLGGTPSSSRGLKDAFQGVDDVVDEEDQLEMPDEEAPDDETPDNGTPDGEKPDDETPEGPEEPQPQPIERYHARFYFGPHFGLIPQMFSNADVAGGGNLLAEFKFSGSLGKRGANQIGVETGFYIGGGNADQLTFSSGHILAAYDRDFLPGDKQRWVISVGGALGGGRQAMRTTETAGPPQCAAWESEGRLREDNRLVAARWGGNLGARFNVGLLVGERRMHEINFSVHPLLGVYGRGNEGTLEDGSNCDEADRFPFERFHVSRVLVTVFTGFGYAFRF